MKIKNIKKLTVAQNFNMKNRLNNLILQIK